MTISHSGLLFLGHLVLNALFCNYRRVVFVRNRQQDIMLADKRKTYASIVFFLIAFISLVILEFGLIDVLDN